MKEYLTVDEARIHTSLAKITIYQAIKRGMVERKEDSKGHRRWVISRASLDAWRREMKDNKYQRFTKKRCKFCGERFETVYKDDVFCSDECEEKYFEAQEIGEQSDGVKPFSSNGTKSLTLAQQIRIIGDVLHPVTEQEWQKAIDRWFDESESILKKWLKSHSLDEIKGKAIIVRNKQCNN